MISAEITRDLFDQDWRLARVFADSGEFADLREKTADQAISLAMAKIRLGRSWGINEADSMAFIFFNNGRPGIQNELYAAKLYDAGYAWDIEWYWDKPEDLKHRKCEGCRLWLKKLAGDEYLPVLDREGNHVSEAFTKAEADSALIWEKNKQIRLSDKWNFVSWAQDMYFWRAVARIKKRHIPNVLRGALTQEEAEDAAASRPQETREQILERRMRETGATDGAIQEAVYAERKKAAEKLAKKSVTEKTLSIVKFPPKNGVPVMAELPPKETVANGQRIYIRKDDKDTLYQYAGDVNEFESIEE